MASAMDTSAKSITDISEQMKEMTTAVHSQKQAELLSKQIEFFKL
jgi:hypothetical protein